MNDGEAHLPARFNNRRAAGRALAASLARLRDADALVLALPRGGVPVAFEIAVGLGAPLDLQLVRKVGAPGNPEFGIGAVADGAPPVIMIDDALVRSVEPPPGYVDAQVARELAEMTRRRERYLGGRPVAEVNGRTVILVDDGIATGGTALAALAAARQRGARQIILAAPVAAGQSLERLRGAADEVECLLVPNLMTAVGNYYDDFRPTSDDEVTGLLDAAERRLRES